MGAWCRVPVIVFLMFMFQYIGMHPFFYIASMDFLRDDFLFDFRFRFCDLWPCFNGCSLYEFFDAFRFLSWRCSFLGTIMSTVLNLPGSLTVGRINLTRHPITPSFFIAIAKPLSTSSIAGLPAWSILPATNFSVLFLGPVNLPAISISQPRAPDSIILLNILWPAFLKVIARVQWLRLTLMPSSGHSVQGFLLPGHLFAIINTEDRFQGHV